MLIDPPIEALQIPAVENRYILAMLTAKRARQLIDGAQPLSERRSDSSITTASMELQEGFLQYVPGDVKVSVPLRPEVEAERLEAERQAKLKREEALIEEARILDSQYANSVKEHFAANAEATPDLSDENNDFTSKLLELFDRQADADDAPAAEADEMAAAEDPQAE